MPARIEWKEYEVPVRPRYVPRFAYDRVPTDIHRPPFIVEILDPEGNVFDVTSRLDKENLGSLTESTEEDLTELTHGDLTMTFFDADGQMERLLSRAEPKELWKVFFHREYERRSRRVWETVFGGVLDQPWSLVYHRKASTVEVQAFSLSKILEYFSASGIKRSITGLTATGSSGSGILTLSPGTTGLLPGDILFLQETAPTGSSQKVTVKYISTSTVVVLTGALNADYTNVEAILETPYYRDKGIVELADLVFAEVPLAGHEVQIARDVKVLPFATLLNPDGLDGAFWTNPRSLTAYSGLVELVSSFGNLNRRLASPTDVWSDEGSTGGTIYPDWTAYRDSEPSSRLGSTATTFDIGSVIAQGTGDGTPGVAWEFSGSAIDHYHSWTKRSSPHRLTLRTDGANVRDFATAATDGLTGAQYAAFVEFDPINGYAWCSGIQPDTGVAVIRYDDGAAMNDFDLTYAAALRFNFRQRAILAHELESATQMGSTVHVIDLDSLEERKTFEWRTDGWPWTIRSFGSWQAGLWSQGFGNEAGVTIWDEDWNVVSEFLISANSGSGNVFGTRWTNPVTGIEHYVGRVGQDVDSIWFILAQEYVGVVPYANFEELSCAAALKEMALASLSFLRVDPLGFGTLRARSFSDFGRTGRPQEIEVPFERTTQQLWEFYRASVEVKGKDPAGEAIEVIRGDEGDSAKRISLQSDLFINQEGHAISIADHHFRFLSQRRRQEEVVSRDQPRLGILDLAKMDGKNWLVLNSETALLEREQDLRLAEV